jgi:hypothetical protein
MTVSTIRPIDITGLTPPNRPKRSLIPGIDEPDDELDAEFDAEFDAVLEDCSAAGSDFGAVFLVAITVKLSTQFHDDA